MKCRLAVLQLVLYLLTAEGRQLSSNESFSGAKSTENGARCEPKQVHLALGDSPGELRVSWATAASGCSSHVHFGEAFGTTAEDSSSSSDWLEPLHSAAAVLPTDSFGPEDFCGAPASEDNFEPPNLQSALLTGLEPGRVYDYRIGHHKVVKRFKAPPRTAPDAQFTFIAYADVGESVHASAKSPGAEFTARRVSEEVLEGNAELVVHVGDISYADGKYKVWDAFLDQIEPYASLVPYQIAIGNHEYGYIGDSHRHHHNKDVDPSGRSSPYDPDWGNFGNDSGGECGVAVAKLFPMPQSRALRANNTDDDHGGNHAHHANPPFWFSYDYGSVHFTTISTEHDLSHGSPQRKWLARDLAAVDRCLTPWLVLLSHRPMYVVHPHKSNRVVGEHIRGYVEPLLGEFGVDLVLSGHIHAYARTCAVYEERCVKHERLGTVHTTLGCGGRKLSSVEHTQPNWLEYAEQEYGYGRIRVDGDRELAFEYVHSESGEVFDSFSLKPKEDVVSDQKCKSQAVQSNSDLQASLEEVSGNALMEMLMQSAERFLKLNSAEHFLKLTSLPDGIFRLCAAFRLC